LNSGNFYISDLEKGKNPQDLRKLRILVAPLDWGLGHATRCIPIIYELLQLNCDVWIAAEGAQETLLRQEFPQLPFLALSGYRVKYGRSVTGTLLNIFIQSRKISRAINHENKWLKKAARENQFDAIISDNRYGLYHAVIPTIFITHQLTIKSPWGKWTERWLQKRNYAYINRFTECWVPDAAGDINLAGELSHPLKKPAVPVQYTGILSRLIKTATPTIKDHLLIILSGPEPQRSIFENKIIRDIAHYPGTATIVRGLPGTLMLIPSSNSIRFYNHLTAEELNIEMNKADYIISRSGYSTIMDIIKLQKKSILVPTPGQTEQEYLATYLQGKKILVSVAQKSFSLVSALQSAKSFSYTLSSMKEENNLPQVIAQFIRSLRAH
jgi:uncharacterized protein (TIGR00661 family)